MRKDRVPFSPTQFPHYIHSVDSTLIKKCELMKVVNESYCE